MIEEIMACFGDGCYTNGPAYFDSPEEEKRARMRNKQITKALKEYGHQELKKLKLLLLGEINTCVLNYD